MNNSELNIEQLLNDPSFKEFQSHGLIDEKALRNLKIRNEYMLLKKTKTQLGAIFELSEKYGLTFDSIHHILYRKPSRKMSFVTRPTNIYKVSNKSLLSLY